MILCVGVLTAVSLCCHGRLARRTGMTVAGDPGARNTEFNWHRVCEVVWMEASDLSGCLSLFPCVFVQDLSTATTCPTFNSSGRENAGFIRSTFVTYPEQAHISH